MIGHVYINGQIGSSYDESGNITAKGVELIDVVSQFSLNGEVEQTIIHINSQGGHVSVGREIAKFIGSIENVFTSAEILCASIATEIHLSVPLQNRSIQEGCEYIIHNPFMANISGDASELEQYAKSIKETESEMINTYHKATGVNKEALAGLMKIETSLTVQQCIDLKFASSITQKMQTRAVALFYNKQMTSKEGLKRINDAFAVITGKAVVVATTERTELAMLIETDKGVLVTPYEDLQVNDPITLEDGTALENGDYLTVDGDTITVTDGLITAFIEAPESTDVPSPEMEALKAELEIVKAELVEAKQVSEIAVAKIEELAKIGSTYVPPVQATVFRTVKTNEQTLSVREQMEARKNLNKK
jgi:ATP-dependent protease ClpP protease subunit